jgi:hypothetical protein
MTSSGTRKRATETRISIIRKAGKMFMNLLQEIFSAFSVFSLLAMRENIRANPVIAYNQYI